MERDRWGEVARLCAEALEQAPAERAAFLDRDCPAELRAEVDDLLARDEGTGILDRPVASIAAGVVPPAGASLHEDSRIGDYRLLRRVGRGGVGQIWLATREGEFQQHVAVKVLRRGMDTEDILRRFRAEREILARLDHPNIARLFDGGATDEDVPYFVMEYIEGLPITDYCERAQLALPDVLHLFGDVCAAVHAAHQNLFVHRDLKPGNILVTGEGVPKLLDFGIAKVLDPDGSEFSVPFTRPDARVMTPDYASPEQLAGEPVTTATDVYSLGVLLYELLVGAHPFRDGTRPRESSSRRAETARATEPARPSQRAATSRRPRLARRLRGDLDTLVLRAMHPEPGRRYASVRELADDIERYLDGKPLIARPDTLGYRLSKFVRRNPAPVGMSVVAGIALMAFSIFSAAQARRLAEERDTALQATEFLVDLFDQADPRAVGGAEVSARELLERGHARLDHLADEPAVQQRLMVAMSRAYDGMDLLERAESLARRAVELSRSIDDRAHAQGQLGNILARQGRGDEAHELLEGTLATWRTHGGDDPHFTAQLLRRLGWLDEYRGEFPTAERRYREAAALLRGVPGGELPYAETLQHLGNVLLAREGPDAAGPVLEEAHAALRNNLPASAAQVALSHEHLGKLETARENFDAAEEHLATSIAMRRDVFGPGSVSEAMARNELAVLLRRRGRTDEAIEQYRGAYGTLLDAFGPEQWFVVQVRYNLASALRSTGAPSALAEAEGLFREALAAARSLRPPDHPDLAHLARPLVELLLESGRSAEALPLAEAVWAACTDRLPPGSGNRVALARALARALASEGRPEDARERLREELERTPEGARGELRTLLAELE